MNWPFFGVKKHPLDRGEAGEVGGVLICVGLFGKLLPFEIVDDTKSNKMGSQKMQYLKCIRISNVLFFAANYFCTPGGSLMGPTK